ncbi:hypothetical protein LAZ67_17001281, partial [Cordylochernes scorpioides]
MVTILENCERVINARPLTYIAEDNDDLVPLTPEMFLREPRAEGEIDLNEFRCNFGKSYEKRKRLLKDFRKRFRSEYLGLLVHQDNRKKQRQLKVGDIVLVEVENRKQINWPMGKITKVFPGTDNVRRLVEVKTKSGFMKRAVQRLFPLEVPSEDVEQGDGELKPAEDEIVREKTPGVESVSVQEKTTPVKVGKVYTRSGRRVKLPIRMADQPVSSAELKKLRTPVRAMFTKAFNELETEIKKKEVKKADVEKILRRLQTHHEKLLILNMRMEEALLRESASEDIFTAEYESVCEYEDNFSNIMTDYEALAEEDDVSTSTISGTAAMNYRLPKLEFKKFGGEPREWITFWSQFSTIDRDPQMPPETKFQYLFQATAENSEAREAVESFPPSADNCPKVIEYIKSRFGEDEMLVEIYVRDLLQNVLQNVRAEGKMSVVKLYDRLETQLRALETLGVARDKFAAMLYPLVESALPEDTLRVWERSQYTVSGRGVQDKLTQLMTFLKTEVKGESRVNMAKAAFKIDNNQDAKDDRSNRKSLSKKNPGSKMPSATDLANTTRMRNNCIFCGNGHPSQECYSGQRMHLPEKKDKAKGKNVCFWCLLPGHAFKKCRIKPRCPVCGGKHYAIMCPTLEAQKTSQLQKAELKVSGESPATEQETANQFTSTTLNNATVGGVYLQTLIVKISGPKGKHNVRVLLDCGSQRSYISKRMVDALGLKRVQQVTLTHNLFGGGEIRQKKHHVYKVNVSSLNNEYMDDLKFLDQEVICGHISQVQDHTILNELKARGINLTDVYQGEERPIHMLIGSDLLSSILTGRMKILQSGVVATETKLGWTVMGPAIGNDMEDSCLIVTSLHVNSFDVQDLWKLDVLGIMDAAETKSRKDLIEASNTHFKETVKRDESGRYIVSLPWIAGHPPVPINRRTTENRLLTTTRNVQGKMLYEKHCRVVFGLTSSPFLLAATIKYHLSLPQFQDNRCAELLARSFYVDNCILSLSSTHDVKKFIKESSDIMMQAKFELRDWMWNEPGITEQDPASILGMKWHLQTDTIAINVQSLKNIDEEKSITKRSILSACHRIFDPIQFTCPATIKIKKMVQDAWKENKSWDEPLNEDRRVEFIKWRKQALELDQIKIPRWILPIKGRTTLHVFCDASAIAYATVIFMRIENASVIFVRFVEARNRLATIKRITIPRLELLACLIGARLLVHVLENLEESPEKIQCWTDSSPALYWIQQQENWAQFVSNRVKEITTLTKNEDWNHVAGEHNPADLPSRGESPSKFIKSGWWEGPKWLQEKKEDWPVSKVQYDLEAIEEERRKTVVIGFVAKKPEENPWYLNLYEGKREVTLTQILRVIAWMLSFKPSEYKGDVISQEELDSAEKSLVKIIQSESIGVEDPKMKQLHAFQDKEGLWRVKTRIVNRNDDELSRLPILIPTNHPVTELIVKSVHEKMYHCGAQTLRSVLREKFWIPKARQLVRHVIHKCPRCRRFETKRVDVPEASLPQHRVRDVVVFEVTGIDLGGPLYLEDGQKVWFVIFTCGVYRAVHLELVTSLSKEALVGAVERFVARRGCPAVIYSDNGTNLVGLRNELYRVNFGVKWKLNPPAAPWWGGWIERIVGLTKKLLRRLLGKRVVNYEEMVTILENCERVINARPLTYIAEDNDDLVPLTPEMFLREPRAEGEIDLNEFRCNFGKSYEKRKRLLKDFRKRFRSEYLGLLVHQDNRKKQRQLKVGDIVLVEVENRKQINWPMGKITKVFPGTDNVRRLVEVKTKSGFMKRAVQRLFPLEVPSEDVEQGDGELKPAEDEIVREKTPGVESVSVQEKTTPVKTKTTDCLAKGPNLLELIPDIMLRFRLNKIGVIADIEKAFLQISVAKEDRKFLRFLWWEDGKQENLRIYQHKRVVFGVTSNPFLLCATLKLHLEQYENESEVIPLLKCMYMDNCVNSVTSLEEAQVFQQQSIDLLSPAGFNLREWQMGRLSIVNSENISVLGMKWDTADDTLTISDKLMMTPTYKSFDRENDGEIENQIHKLTKRIMLSEAHAVFDPLGLFSPFTIVPKIILQQCWKSELKWDQPVSEDIAKKFVEWQSQIPELLSARIPRWVMRDGFEQASLHVFCDASQDAYATCIYLRTVKNKERQIFGFGTDSSTALRWIQNEKPWATFVNEICSISKKENWHHVSGVNNPADLPSRGSSVKKLIEHKWWEGPSFLWGEEASWNQFDPIFDEEEINKELKKTVNIAVNSTKDNFMDKLERYGDYHRIVRIVAYLLRFKRKTVSDQSRPGQHDKMSKEISVEEFEEAEKVVLRHIQLISFGRDDKRINKLNAFTYEYGLYRIKSQLYFGEDDYDTRCPIVLPGENQVVKKIRPNPNNLLVLVKLLIRKEHEMMSHAGIQTTQQLVRRRFWILKGKRTIRSIISACATCHRYNSKRVQTESIPIPATRIGSTPAFGVIGVDLAGPLTESGGKKIWVVLYTCAVYRAVHLELTKTVSTEGFLDTFRRFVARRGRPSIVYSDNSLNFVGCNSLFKKVNWNDVLRYATVQRIKWNFNPPTAAFWGGWWERLVGLEANDPK